MPEQAKRKVLAGRDIRRAPNAHLVADPYRESQDPWKTFRTGRMPRPARR
jgi:hypothetical protein